MSEGSKTVILIGIMFLAIVIVFLFSGPHYFSSNVSFLDTELSESSDKGKSVRVKMDLSHQEELEDFPYRIGEWRGIDEDIEGLKEQLGAETLIKSSYSLDNPFNPVFLLLMQSASRASFHPPTVCFPALGYDIEEETKDTIHVTDISWISKMFDLDLEDMPEWIQQDLEASPEYGEISVKKLVVNHKNRADKRVVFYVYIKDRKITSNEVSMLQVSIGVPLSGSCEAESEKARTFMGEVIPLLFEPKEEEEKMFLTYILDMGIGGYFIVVLIFSIPIVLMLAPIVLARKKEKCRNI